MATIKVTCTGSDHLDIAQLSDFQGDLKVLTDDNLDKLTGAILKYGFTAPVFVWKHSAFNYILDGHQRVKALEALEADGYSIPPVPIVYVEAKNKKEAKEKLLHISSQYGEFQYEGVQAFAADLDLPALDLRIVNIEMPLTDIGMFDFEPIDREGYEPPDQQNCICPECGHEGLKNDFKP